MGFQVDAGRCRDARCRKAVGRTELCKGRFQLCGAGPPPAPDAQHTDLRDQVQRITRREKGQGKVGALCLPRRNHPGRGLPGNGEFRPIPHRPARQQPAADALDAPRLQHGAVLVPGPRIHGKHTVGIGGRGNDRHRTTDRRQRPGQIVGPAQMARKDRHRKMTALVQHHHGRVHRLAPAVGRNGPHRNAHSPHKDQGIRMGELLRGPIGKAGPTMAAAGHSAGQGTGQLLGQRQPFFRKGEIGAGHWSAPLRNSVVKVGS